MASLKLILHAPHTQWGECLSKVAFQIKLAHTCDVRSLVYMRKFKTYNTHLFLPVCVTWKLYMGWFNPWPVGIGLTSIWKQCGRGVSKMAKKVPTSFMDSPLQTIWINEFVKIQESDLYLHTLHTYSMYLVSKLVVWSGDFAHNLNLTRTMWNRSILIARTWNLFNILNTLNKSYGSTYLDQIVWIKLSGSNYLDQIIWIKLLFKIFCKESNLISKYIARSQTLYQNIHVILKGIKS